MSIFHFFCLALSKMIVFDAIDLYFTAMHIGHWIRDRRKTLGLTQAKLAQRAGLSLSTIQRLETAENLEGQAESSVRLVASALLCTTDDMLRVATDRTTWVPFQKVPPPTAGLASLPASGSDGLLNDVSTALHLFHQLSAMIMSPSEEDRAMALAAARSVADVIQARGQAIPDRVDAGQVQGVPVLGKLSGSRVLKQGDSDRRWAESLPIAAIGADDAFAVEVKNGTASGGFSDGDLVVFRRIELEGVPDAALCFIRLKGDAPDEGQLWKVFSRPSSDAVGVKIVVLLSGAPPENPVLARQDDIVEIYEVVGKFVRQRRRSSLVEIVSDAKERVRADRMRSAEGES